MIALVPYHLVTYVITIAIAVTSCYSSLSSLVTVSLGSAVTVLLVTVGGTQVPLCIFLAVAVAVVMIVMIEYGHDDCGDVIDISQCSRLKAKYMVAERR